jgi:Zn-dependent protease
MVALAGPVSNVALAFLFAIPINTGLVTSDMVGFGRFDSPTDDLLGYVIGSLVFWNLLIASFNLIPLAPLDGFRVALGILPRGLASKFARLERHGPMILLLIVMFDVLGPGPSILFSMVRPILNGLSSVILGGQLL